MREKPVRSEGGTVPPKAEQLYQRTATALLSKDRATLESDGVHCRVVNRQSTIDNRQSTIDNGLMSGHAALAPYAIASSRGREHAEPADALRGPFALDRHRIINSTAFRRLDGKTQVFAPEFHDHFRNRLEHTLEVASVARTLARALRAREDLTEAIALAHDLGHPPFGHAGEVALSQAMSGHGGFNHNLHSLRVVEYLEHPYPAFRGLNLTHETRAGMRLHATRFDDPQPRGGSPGVRAAGMADASPSVESQIASLADRVAYDCHDLEDAIGAGFVSLSDLDPLELWRAAREGISAASDVSIFAIRRDALDRMLDVALLDAVESSHPLLASVRSVADVSAATAPLVRFSDAMESRLIELERFLSEQVYTRHEIVESDARGRRMITDLFDAYRRSPSALTPRFLQRIDDQGAQRVVCDYIAGMTDRFCTREHERMTSGG